LLGLSGAALVAAPVQGFEAPCYRKLTRYSAAFALLSDMALMTMGGALKRHEKLSGRYADVLAWMYLASATLKRFHDEGRPEDDKALLRWSLELALYNIEDALEGILNNFPSRPLAWVMRQMILPFGRTRKLPSDHLGGQVARVLLNGDLRREKLTADIFVPKDGAPGLGMLERTLEAAVAARPVRRKIDAALRAKNLEKAPLNTLGSRALEGGIITPDEKTMLDMAATKRLEAVQVDWFDEETYRKLL
jgi:acyl-CoA dehydrogenase